MSRKRNNVPLRSLSKYDKHHRNDNVFVTVDHVPSVIVLLEDSKNTCDRITTSSDDSDKSSLQSIHLANSNINCWKMSDHPKQKVYDDVNSKRKVCFSVDNIRPFDAQRTMNRKKRKGNTILKMNRISEQQKYPSGHKTSNKLRNTATYCINKKKTHGGALTKLNPVIELGKEGMEGPHYLVKLYGNEVCRKTKVLNHFKGLDNLMSGIAPKVYCVKNNQFNANVQDVHFKSRKSFDDEIYKNVLQKKFVNKTGFYPYSMTPSIYYMTSFKNSKKLVDNANKYDPYNTDEFYSCTRFSAKNTMKFSDDTQIINPCYSNYKQFAVSDACIKSTTHGKNKQKGQIKPYNKTSKSPSIVLISNHSELGLKNNKRPTYLTTKFNTKLNENRKPFLPTMEINVGKLKTNRRKYYKYLNTDSSRHDDSTSIEQLNIIYSDYPEIEKNSSVINLHHSSSNLKTRCMGVDTSSVVKANKKYISSRKSTKSRFQQVKLRNDQRVDEDINRNSESKIEYTDSMRSESKQRYRSRRNSKAELFEKYKISSQQNPSEDTSTSFGYFDIKEDSKVKLKVIYSLNRHKKEVGGIVSNLKKFFKGALRCKSEDTSVEPKENETKRSQILPVVSSFSLHKIEFRGKTSSSNHYCYFEEIQPRKNIYTKDIGTSVYLATIPQNMEYNSNYNNNKPEDNTYKITTYLTKPKLHKPVEIQPSTEISSLENPIFSDRFINNIGRRWVKYKICQDKKIEKSSKTSRNSSFTPKFERYQWKSFHQQVRKASANRQNKHSSTCNDNKISTSVLSNLYPRMPYVRSSDIRRRCDDFCIFQVCPRNARRCRILRFDSPRIKPESDEWIVHPLQLKTNNRIKRHTTTEKNTFTPVIQKLQTYKYFQQNKSVRELSPFLKRNVNAKSTESSESSTSSFEKCIIEYVNSFQNMVHKLKETGLLSIGNKNKKVSKNINEISNNSWLKNLSTSNKNTNKANRSSKSSIWQSQLYKVESHALLQFGDNQEDKLLLTKNIPLKSDTNRENKNTEQIFSKSNLVNFDIKEINNRCDIEIDRTTTPVYSCVSNKDESGKNCTKQKYMKIDAISTKTCSPNNVKKKHIDVKNIQNIIYGDEETRGQNATMKTDKITKQKNKNIGRYKFSFNKFRHIGHKLIGVKTILKAQKNKNSENEEAKALAVGDYDKKIKTPKLLSKHKAEKTPNEKEINSQDKLQETHAITMFGTEYLKDNLRSNEKYTSSFDKYDSEVNVFDIIKDNQKNNVCNTKKRGNSVNRIQNPQEYFIASQYNADSYNSSSSKSSCKTKGTLYLKPIFIVTKKKTRNLIGHLVLVEYNTKPKKPLFYRGRLPIKIKDTEK